MAERVGFEPTEGLPLHLISSQARSTGLRHLSAGGEASNPGRILEVRRRRVGSRVARASARGVKGANSPPWSPRASLRALRGQADRRSGALEANQRSGGRGDARETAARSGREGGEARSDLARDDLIQATGSVDKILGGGRYQITLENGQQVTAQLSGRMRRFRIRVIPGDRVTVGLSPYDPTHGFITFRLKEGQSSPGQ